MKRVVLVNPDSLDLFNLFPTRTVKKIEAQPPLGLCYMAAVLEKEHHDVSIIDNYVYHLSAEELAHAVLSRRPDYVGFYSTTLNFANGLTCARLVKRADKEITVVFGGPHVCAKTEEALTHDCIDYVILGEGEYLFRDLVGSNGAFSSPGIISRKDSSKKIKSNRVFQAIDNLDALPLPARHLLVMDRYPRKEGMLPWPMDTLVTSRGCPYHCSFCSTLSKSSYRFRSAENVVEEILYLKDTYNTQSLYFREDNFTADPKRVMDLCRLMIEKDAVLPFQCEIRSNSVTSELMGMMKDAGCRRVWFGAESGSQRVLNLINKGATLRHSHEAVRICKDAGIRIGAAFVIGFPGETRSDIEQTFQFACDLGADEAWFQTYVAYPGSTVYDESWKKGLINTSYNGIGFIETDQFSFEDMVAYETQFNHDYDELTKKSDVIVQKTSPVYDIRFKSVHDYKQIVNPYMKESYREIVLYGASHSALMVDQALRSLGKKSTGIIDGNKNIHGRRFAGHVIKGPDDIPGLKPDAVLICSSGYQDEIYDQLNHLEGQGIDIVKLYDRYFRKPEDVSIMITGRCPLTCVHCDCWSQYPKTDEMDRDELTYLFQDIYNTGCRAVNITGGEPFVRDDLDLILKRCRDTGFQAITLNTNGFLVTEDKIKTLKSYGIKNIGVSIDGDPQTHNKIRGHEKAYDRAVNTLELCRTHGIGTTVAMVLNRMNYDKIPHVLTLAEAKGSSVVLQPALKTLAYSSDRINDYEIKDEIPELRRIFDQLRQDEHLRRYLKNSDEHLDLILDYLVDPQKNTLPCRIGYHRSHIMPDGTVMACLAMGKVGNIRDAAFSSLWYSEKYEKYRKAMINGQCPKCMLNCYISHNLSQHTVN